MATEFSLDLRKARRQAGFLQSDIAQLLGSQQSAVSDLEGGRRRPSLLEIVTLSLIYGRSFESLFAAIMAETRQALLDRLKSLPDGVTETAATFNRAASIRRLGEQLTAQAERDAT